jgi:hypothetical protein
MAEEANKKSSGEYSKGDLNRGNVAGKATGDGQRKEPADGKSQHDETSKRKVEDGKSPVPDE